MNDYRRFEGDGYVLHDFLNKIGTASYSGRLIHWPLPTVRELEFWIENLCKSLIYCALVFCLDIVGMSQSYSSVFLNLCETAAR